MRQVHMGGVDFFNKPEEGFAQGVRGLLYRKKAINPVISTSPSIS